MELASVNYQCPSCGGPLRYDGGRGRLVCDHCGSEFEVAEVEALYAQKEQDAASAAEQASAETLEGGYVCSSCGAELLTDGTTAVSTCPYCGNPVVLSSRVAGCLAPDLVVPFRLGHKDAVEALERHYKGKPLLPASFRTGNHVNEVQGVYVPFWLYDAHASGSATFDATRERRHMRGNDEVIETDHYDVRRAGTMDFSRVPVDASTKMPDAHMDAIEPYDYGEMVPFSLAYMPGFVANRWDESVGDCRPRAAARMDTSVSNALADTVSGYDSVTCTGTDATYDWKGERYAMLPVWMLHTSWEGKDFLFAMNGQTGRLVGDLPVSKPRLAGFAALAFALAFAFMWWVGGTPQDGGDWAIVIGVAAVVAIVVGMLLVQSMKSAQEADQADRYLAADSLRLTDKSDRYSHTTRQVIHHEPPKES